MVDEFLLSILQNFNQRLLGLFEVLLSYLAIVSQKSLITSTNIIRLACSCELFSQFAIIETLCAHISFSQSVIFFLLQSSLSDIQNMLLISNQKRVDCCQYVLLFVVLNFIKNVIKDVVLLHSTNSRASIDNDFFVLDFIRTFVNALSLDVNLHNFELSIFQ